MYSLVGLEICGQTVSARKLSHPTYHIRTMRGAQSASSSKPAHYRVCKLAELALLIKSIVQEQLFYMGGMGDYGVLSWTSAEKKSSFPVLLVNTSTKASSRACEILKSYVVSIPAVKSEMNILVSV